jgi:hypothetical protein
MKKFPFSHFYIFFFTICLLFTSCNKPFVMPNLTGTWKIGAIIKGNKYEAQIAFHQASQDRLNQLELSGKLTDEIIDKISFAAKSTIEILTDLKTITFSSDGTFQFTYASTFIPATGTFTQDGTYVFFTFLSGHFPEATGQLMGNTDGLNFDLYFTTSTITPIFMSYLILDPDERELLFGEDDHFSFDLEGVAYYTKN